MCIIVMNLLLWTLHHLFQHVCAPMKLISDLPRYRLATKTRIFCVPCASLIGKERPTSNTRTMPNGTIRVRRHLPILFLIALVPQHLCGSYASCMSVSSSPVHFPRHFLAASLSKFLLVPAPPMKSVHCCNYVGMNLSTIWLLTTAFSCPTVMRSMAFSWAALNMLDMPDIQGCD